MIPVLRAAQPFSYFRWLAAFEVRGEEATSITTVYKKNGSVDNLICALSVL